MAKNKYAMNPKQGRFHHLLTVALMTYHETSALHYEHHKVRTADEASQEAADWIFHLITGDSMEFSAPFKAVASFFGLSPNSNSVRNYLVGTKGSA